MEDTTPLDADCASLAMGIALNQGFGLHVLVCDDPIVAGATVARIAERVGALLGGEPVLEPLDPYHDASHGPARVAHGRPISFETLVAAVLDPLLDRGTRPSESADSGAPEGKRIFLIDGSWAPERDTRAWYRFFGRLNELRNRVIRDVHTDLLLVLTPSLYRELAREAPDLWSVRSATAHIEVPDSERWLMADSLADGWSRDELIGRLERLSAREFIDVLDRLRLPIDVRARRQSRTAQAGYVVAELAEAGRLGELAALLNIKPDTSLAHELHILHLSGLCVSRQSWQEKRALMREMLDGLLAWQSPSGAADMPERIELICISGDLAYSGSAEEYGYLIDELLEPLLAGLGLSREHVFWAPGNHDVDWRAIDPSTEAGLREVLDTPAAVDALLSDPHQRAQAVAHMRSYVEATRGFFGELIAEQDPAYATSRLCRVGDVTVGVACLNSAWRSGPDSAPLWLGRRQLQDARRGVAGADLRIAVMHHGFEALHAHERELAAEWCRHEFDLVLHGPVQERRTSGYVRGSQAGCIVAGFSFQSADEDVYGWQIIRVEQSRSINVAELRATRLTLPASSDDIDRRLGRLTPAQDLLEQDDIAQAAARAMDALDRETDDTARIAALSVLMAALKRTIWDQTEHPVPHEQRARVLVTMEVALDELSQVELPDLLKLQLANVELRFANWVRDRRRLEHARECGQRAGALERESHGDIDAVLPPNRLQHASVSAIDAALDALPKDEHPWERRLVHADLLFRAGHRDEAIAELMLLSQEFPERPLIETSAAEKLTWMGRFDEALAHARRAFEGLPGVGQRHLLVQCLLRLGKVEEAWRYLEPVLDTEHPGLIVLIARAAETQAPQRAPELWARYLEHQPDNAPIRVRRAARLFELGHHEEAAEEAWRAATGPGSEALTARALFGCARLQMGGLADGDAARERTLHIAELIRERFPGDAQAQNHVLELYQAHTPLDVQPVSGSEVSYSAGAAESSEQAAAELANVLEAGYRSGLLSLESLCEQLSGAMSQYLAHAIHGRAFFALFEDPEPSQDLDLDGREILMGELELLLLHELGLLVPLGQLVRDSGARLLMFKDIHARIREEMLAFRLRPPEHELDALERARDDIDPEWLEHYEQVLAARVDAARRITDIQAWLGVGLDEGWVRVISRPRQPDAVPRPRTEPWGPRCREWLIQATSWYEALRDHPERRLVSADSFILSLAGEMLPLQTMIELAWEPETLTSFQQSLRTLGEQRLSFAALACSLAAEPTTVKRQLARLGVYRAVSAKDLAAWLRAESDSANAELDGLERVARQAGHALENAASYHLASLYGEAMWLLWTQAAAPLEGEAEEIYRASNQLLGRMEGLDAHRQDACLAWMLWELFARAVASPHRLVPRQADGYVPDSEAPGARLIQALHDWAKEKPNRRAVYDDALRMTVLLIEDVTAPSAPKPKDILLLPTAWGIDLIGEFEVLELDQGWLAALCIISALWPADTLSARLSIPIQAEGKTHVLRVEDVLQAGVQALERAPASLEAGGKWSYQVPLTQSNLQLYATVPLEALLLRADLGQLGARARDRIIEHCVDDHVLYEQFKALMADPEAPSLRRSYARRAAATPWRLVRAEPRCFLRWGVSLDPHDTLPADLDDLRALLGEPGPLEQANVHDELFARLEPGGVWAGQHGGNLAVRASELPCALAALFSGAVRRMSQREEIMTNLLAGLKRIEHGSVGRLARDVAYACVLAKEVAELRTELPQHIESVLSQLTDTPEPDSLAASEPELFRVCKRIVNELANKHRVTHDVPSRELLWLTHRLYQWLSAQLLSMPPDDRARAIRELCRAARSEPTLGFAMPQTSDVLDPAGYGPGQLEHRRLAVLNVLFHMHIADMQESDTASPESDASLERAEENPRMLELGTLLSDTSVRVLTQWAEAPLSDYERELRRLGESVSALWWQGPATVPDAALTLLLLRDLAHFGELSPTARLRWIEEIPDSIQEMGAPPRALVTLILQACSVCVSVLTPPERTLLEQRITSAALPDEQSLERFTVLMALYASGEEKLADTIAERMAWWIERPEAPGLMALYSSALLERMTEPAAIAARLAEVLDAARSRDVDEAPFLEALIDSLDRRAHELDTNVRQRAKRVLRALIDSRPGVSDPHIAERIRKLDPE